MPSNNVICWVTSTTPVLAYCPGCFQGVAETHPDLVGFYQARSSPPAAPGIGAPVPTCAGCNGVFQ